MPASMPFSTKSTDLLIDLGATDEQIDFPLVYAIGRDGIAIKKPDEEGPQSGLAF